MANILFNDNNGAIVSFDVSQDIITFNSSYQAAATSISQEGQDVRITNNVSTILLADVSKNDLTTDNFTFENGSLLLLGDDGDTLLTGGTGQDYFGLGRGGNDTVIAGSGNDVIDIENTLSADDSLDGGAGDNDILFVSGTFTASMAPSTLRGVERIVVGDGAASIALSNEAVVSAATTQNFTVDASSQSEGSSLSLDAGAVLGRAISVLSGDGNDDIAGGGGNDFLSGGDGADTLLGGDGNDTLIGGLGADTMDGGAGNDTFGFGFASIERTDSSPNIPDVLLDFQGAGVAGGDVIDLPTFNLSNIPLAFNSVASDFNYIGPNSGAQPNANAGDGFVDVFWKFDSLTSQFEVWVDADDNGLFDEGDLRISIQRAAGETNTFLNLQDFGANFLVWRGTAAAEMRTGDIGNDTMYGLGGDDTLAGAGGADELHGGQGNDSLSGEGGSDQLYGGDGADTLDGGLDRDRLDGDAGNDLLRGGDGADSLYGGLGSDTLEGGNDADFLSAGAANGGEDLASDRNLLRGEAGDDQLYGNAGSDTLQGGADDDVLGGGSGNDLLQGDDGDDRLGGDSGNDTLQGGAGDDTLSYQDGADVLTGGSGADLFEFFLRSPSSDFAAMATITDFSASSGDKINVGSSNGFVSFIPLVWRGALAAIDVSVGPALGMTLPGNDLGPDFAQMWWIPATEGAAPAGGWLVHDRDGDGTLGSDDFIVRVGSATNPVTLTAADFVEDTFTVYAGTPGDDVRVGDIGNDTMYGVAGNDSLSGEGGSDQLYGGDGADTLDGGLDRDRLDGDAGNDLLRGGDGADSLYGGLGSDTLEGGNDADFLSAGAANGGEDLASDRNLLRGEAGDDQLYGNAGSDTLQGGADDDVLGGGSGNDLLQGGVGNDRLSGDSGNDTLQGGAGDDTLSYQDGADVLSGGSGFDLAVFSVASSDVTRRGLTDGSTELRVGTHSVLVNMDIEDLQFTDRVISYSDLSSQIATTNLPPSGEVTISGVAEKGSTLTAVSTLDDPDGMGALQYQWLRNSIEITGATSATLLLEQRDVGTAISVRVTYTDGEQKLETVVSQTEVRVAHVNSAPTGGVSITGQAIENSVLTAVSTLADEDGLGELNYQWVRGTTDIAGATAATYTLTGSDVDSVISVRVSYIDNMGTAETRSSAATSSVMFTDRNEFGTDGAEQIVGGAGNDTLIGLGGNDTLLGAEGNDSLVGGSGNDIVRGGAGNDVLSGGAGDDLLDGGLGYDTVDYSDATTDIVVDINLARAQVVSAQMGTDQYGSIEAIRGGAGNDLLVGNASGNIIDGGDGNDALYGRAGGDRLRGGAGNDRLEGGAGNDRLSGEDGNDIVLGGDANDLIGGENGNDFVSGGAGNDGVYGGAGNDTLSGGAGNDLLNGGDGYDTADYSDATTDIVANINWGGAQFVSAEMGFDRYISIEALVGGAGNDLLVGNMAGNIIDGGDGDDEIYGLGDGDILRGGAGNDQIEGSGGNDRMSGGAGDADVLSYYNSAGGVTVDLRYQGVFQAVGGFSGTDWFDQFEDLYGSNRGGDLLIGSVDDNRILGFGGDDRIFGFDGNDELFGQQGNDLLAGGVGADALTGGAGADVFDFNHISESTSAARDTVRDFSAAAGDIIDLSGIDANSAVAGNQAFTFVGSAAFGSAGDLRFVTNGTDGFVIGDVDGNGSIDLNILLLGVTSMGLGDFVL